MEQRLNAVIMAKDTMQTLMGQSNAVIMAQGTMQTLMDHTMIKI
jgi:hypothetical protein